jgi:uncharacterized protein (DUF58 family)
MTTATDEDLLFDDEFLKKLEYLNIISKRLFAGQWKAERRARARGTGLEFADHRMYVSGDDFRHLDWKAYLRLNRLILKLFEEEQDLPIYFLLDCSRSMHFGNPRKLDYARRVAAALCYIGLANLDRVNMIGYAERVRAELPPQRGKGSIFRVFRFLKGLTPDGETDAREAFKSYCSGARRRGLAVVISDFLDNHGFEGALDLLRYFRHDVFVIHITCQEEIHPMVRGEVRLTDAENGLGREITITPSLLNGYGEQYKIFCEQLERYCWKYRLGHIRASTDFAFEDLILRVFRQGRFLK